MRTDCMSSQQELGIMRDESGIALMAVFFHPDLDGQYVSAFTKLKARTLVSIITGKDLDEDRFTRTGKFVYNSRIWSGELYERIKNAPKGHFNDVYLT